MSGAVRRVVLFDGVCNLCNHAVTFIIDRDPRAEFRFCALQSESGRELLAGHGYVVPDPPDTMVLIEGDRIYTESTAALRIAPRLSGAWKLAGLLRVVPRPLRDRLYRIVSRNRYRWFGRTEQCRVPTAALLDRFL